jgi:hypothetical protein
VSDPVEATLLTTRSTPGLLAVAAVLAAVLGVTPARAATAWTAQPGGPVSLKSGTLVLTDTKTRANIVCASSRFSGSLKSGSELPSTGLGSITAGSFANCSNALGPSFALTATNRSFPPTGSPRNRPATPARKCVADPEVGHVLSGVGLRLAGK